MGYKVNYMTDIPKLLQLLALHFFTVIELRNFCLSEYVTRILALLSFQSILWDEIVD